MKSLRFWQFCGIVFTAVLGTLLHFLYNWTGSPFVALFSAVNESTWEHMKLLFFPSFIFTMIQARFIGKEYPNFWCVKLIGVTVGLIAIPVLFYTANGAFGTTPGWVNVLFFFLTIFIEYGLETHLFSVSYPQCRFPLLSIIFWVLLAAAFAVFTFFPPKIPLFLDPITLTYGI